MSNSIETLRDILTKEYLKPAKVDGYICPICGSGTGKKGTGITTKDGKHYTCWKGCFTNSDIIDIVAQVENIQPEYKFKVLFEKYNITPDYVKAIQDIFSGTDNSTKDTIKEEIPENIPTDYTDFFNEAHKHINDTDYWKKRGLSFETVKRYRLGYVDNKLVIPTSKYSYNSRSVNDNDSFKYMKPKGIPTRIFNIDILSNYDKNIFITEGEIDSLSIIDLGFQSIGLGSVSNINLLISILKENKPKMPLIISLDNDDAGIKATDKLCKELDKLKIKYYVKNISGIKKDPNELLVDNREQLKMNIETAIEEIKQEEKQEKENQIKELEQNSALYDIPNFLKDIANQGQNYIPTGFTELDKLLDGGLYSGLYIVGAISSLGKTTFVLQIADNIAKQGYPVLIFSLEMAKKELIAKSISRISFVSSNKNKDLAKTTRGILTGSKYQYYKQEEKDLINKSINEIYKEYAKNIFISEGIGDIGIEKIKEKVDNYKKITGKAPVVIIDYLQILAPVDTKRSMTDKQIIDKNVMELKRLSRDYKTAVIGISSFNRENYLAPVNLTSFKESGAIEYSSDVLIALQYSGMDYQDGDTEQKRYTRIRELIKKQQQFGKDGMAQSIQVKILKNRNGVIANTDLLFYPKYNCFEERKEISGIINR